MTLWWWPGLPCCLCVFWLALLWQVGCSSSCHHAHSAAEGDDHSVTEKVLGRIYPIGSPSFVRSGSHRGLVLASQEGLTFVGICRMLFMAGFGQREALVETDGRSGDRCASVPHSPSDYISSNCLALLLLHPPVRGSESRFCRQTPPSPQKATGLWLNPHSHSHWLRCGHGFVPSPPHLLVSQLSHHIWEKLPALISFLKKNICCVYIILVKSWVRHVPTSRPITSKEYGAPGLRNLPYFTPFFLGVHNHWRRKWKPSPVFFPKESHGERSLVGYSPQCQKELDPTEWLSTDNHQ